MGLFSKIFGGGGSSTSTANNQTNVTVNPVTSLSVDFDLDKLVEVLGTGNENNILLLKEGLEIDKQQQNINKLNLLLDNENLTQNKKFYETLGSFTPLIAVSLIYLVFIKKRTK